MKKKAFFGLGNPGPQYRSTRHNAGFMSIDSYIEKYNNVIKSENKKNYMLDQINRDDDRLLLVKPMTFMNLSGKAVRQVCEKKGLEAGDIVVIYDDVSLPTGKIRLRDRGSAGGQKGMRSIIESMGTDLIKRIKIGIGPKDDRDLRNFVLSGFTKDEQEPFEWTLNQVVEAMTFLLDNDFKETMNRFNGSSWEADSD